jgi:hypothetical protein
MTVDDLKDKWIEIKDKFSNFIEEDPSINSIREKFESLSSQGQKLVIISILCIFGLILIYIPYSYFSVASEQEEQFEFYRATTRELLKVGKGPVGSSRTQRGNLEMVQEQLNESLTKFTLMPDQLLGVDLQLPEGESLAKPPIKEEVLVVKLAKLNLDQIVQIGADIQTQFPDLKMTGLSIKADAVGPGYFNTIFKLSKYYLPSSETSEGENRPKRPIRPIRPKRKSEEDVETE